MAKRPREWRNRPPVVANRCYSIAISRNHEGRTGEKEVNFVAENKEGFTYFQVAYTTIAYIYLAAAIFILKDDFIKKMQEVMKIKQEQKNVREEIKRQEEKKEEPKEDKEQKKKEDKEDDESDGDEPQGSEA